MIHHLKSAVQPSVACLACGTRCLLSPLIATNNDIEVGGLQCGEGRLKMRAVPGFDNDLEDHGLGWQIREDALMGNLDDIGACLAQDGDNRAELTGSIHDVELQFRKPAFPRELTRQHAGQEPCIDIASAQYQAERTTLEARLMGEHSRQ